jgi:hypothetical protein
LTVEVVLLTVVMLFIVIQLALEVAVLEHVDLLTENVKLPLVAEALTLALDGDKE